VSGFKPEFRDDPQTWAKQVKRILPDEFCHKVIDGAMRVLEDTSNPIRLHLFAASIRELLTHVMHGLAPDEEVEKCSWYAPEENTRGPTRRQRAIYITRGGIAEERVGVLGSGISATQHKEVLAVMGQLNKYTHVRPRTVVEDPGVIEKFASAALKTIDSLFYAVKITRASLLNAIQREYGEEFDRFVVDTLASAEELAGRTDLEEPYPEAFHILNISSATVWYRTEGSLNDNLRYRIEMSAPVDDIAKYELMSCAFSDGEFPCDD
jgi:hypothetical protein